MEKPGVTSVNIFGTKLSLRIKPHELDTWNKFVELAEREKMSASKILEGLVTNYIKAKYPGNPQPPLERFTGEIKERKVYTWCGECGQPLYSEKERRMHFQTGKCANRR